MKNGAGNLILRVSRQPAHSVDRLFQELCHASMIRA
jgi:hypothetical protein